MPAQILTPDDLRLFKRELIKEIQLLLKNHMQPAEKKWLKSHEVRKILKISPGTLQNLRLNGTLPYSKIGGIIFYAYADVLNMITNHKTIKKP